jgi:hypothetical protein
MKTCLGIAIVSKIWMYRRRPQLNVQKVTTICIRIPEIDEGVKFIGSTLSQALGIMKWQPVLRSGKWHALYIPDFKDDYCGGEVHLMKFPSKIIVFGEI